MSGKAVAEKAVKAAKGINWGLLEKLVKSDDGRKELVTLRRTMDETRAQLDVFRNKEPVNINWEYYKSELDPALVTEFKTAYESITFDEYTGDVTPQFDAKFQELESRAGEAEQEAREQVAKLQAQAKALEHQKKNLRTLTANDYFKDNPKVLEKIDDEIRRGIWGPIEKEDKP